MKTKVLDEIPIGQLLEELMNRCSPACFIGNRHEGGDDGKVSWYETKGHPTVCYGLCQELALTIQASYIKHKLEDSKS